MLGISEGFDCWKLVSDEAAAAVEIDVLLDDDDEDDAEGVALLSDEIEDELAGCFCDIVDGCGVGGDGTSACMLD